MCIYCLVNDFTFFYIINRKVGAATVALINFILGQKLISSL